MARIEDFAQPQIVGMPSPTVIEAQDSVSAHRPHCASERHQSARADVGEVGQRMTVALWQSAISKADDLIDLFEAEARCFDALWRQHSDFGHKADYDCALSNEHKARELRDALVRKLKEHQA